VAPRGRAAGVLLRAARAREEERAHRPRIYYGWPMLVGLSAAETLSWGVLYYAFPVFIRPIEREMGWSRTEVTGAFSLALLVAGVAAIPVGHWLDARGARGLMTAGSVLGAVLFGALATVDSLPLLYAVWAGIGLVMAMVLYEPAFAVVATWFVRHRDRALTVLTLFGGLGSTLMVPLAAWLLEHYGWRRAVLTLSATLACTTIPVHWLLLRRAPSAVGQAPDGDPVPAHDAPLASEPRAPSPPLGDVLAEGRFWGFTSALVLSSLVGVATCVHLIPYLTGNGVSAATAGAALGLVGLMQLPGRLLFGPIRRRLAWEWTAAVVFLVQSAALAILSRAASGVALAAFVGLFGMANGMSTLLRASTLAELYGPERYGRVSGIVALFTTPGRAAGPVIASVAYAASGSYERAFGGLAAVLALAAALVLLPPAVRLTIRRTPSYSPPSCQGAAPSRRRRRAAASS
jgi:MFS family permease